MVRNRIKKKILFLFDSRATFAYSANVVKHINKKIKIQNILTGSYLDNKFNINIDYFKKNKIKITKKIKFQSPDEKRKNWSINLGQAIKKYSIALRELNPDLVVLTGDRVETLGFCIACSYMKIPIAHIQAGDKSGHIDDSARGAIAKFANIHFASCEDSKKRLINWGEEPKRVFNVGAPQLDDIHEMLKIKDKKKNKDKILVIFHPVLNEVKELDVQVKNLYLAVTSIFKKNIIWIYPNSDLGFEKITEKIKKSKFIKVIKNLNRDDFLNLLLETKIIIGNSSCGIIEAPSFKIPVINIGTRQNGRPKAINIVNSDYSLKDIKEKILYTQKNNPFNIKIKKTKNIFYKKESGKNTAKLICKLINYINKFKKF